MGKRILALFNTFSFTFQALVDIMITEILCPAFIMNQKIELFITAGLTHKDM